jgi:CPA2 family monovalent cation:H+ antiporter-2
VHTDPRFLVEVGVLLLLLGAAGAVAWRVGLSAVPLFLLAGLAVGDGGLFPAPAAADFLAFAAGIGVVLLMLTLGLEFSSTEFAQSVRRHTPSGLVDLVLNATPGMVAGLLLDLPPAGVLAMAGITWVSSSGIVARTLVDLGRLGYRETPAVLSVLVLEDIAMAAYLPVLVVLLAGGGLGNGLIGMALAVGTVTIVLLLAGPAGPRLDRLLSHASPEQVMLRTLGLTLVVAGLAERAGVSAAVGAFLVGLAISGSTADQARKVLEPLRDLFAAAFFLSFGYHTDPRQIPAALPAALLLAVVTTATKVATGWYAARRDGVGPRGRRRAGLALVARGEFNLVIAGLAVGAGIQGIEQLATAYVMVMAVGGPILARLSGQGRDLPRTARSPARRPAGMVRRPTTPPPSSVPDSVPDSVPAGPSVDADTAEQPRAAG